MPGPTTDDAGFFRHFSALLSAKLAYLRAHGRNARGYIAGRSVAERFDYDYSAKELEEMAERAAKVVKQADQVHLIFNNNAANYAPKAATAMQNILLEKHLTTVPEPAAQTELAYV